MEKSVENNKMLFRASLFLQEGQSESALEILESLEPEDEQQKLEVAYYLGWCYVLHRRWSDAADTLAPFSLPLDDEREVENRIDRDRLALCFLRLGNAAVQFTRYEEATRHFSKCIKLLNDKRVKLPAMVRVKAHYSLAMSLMMRGLYDAAIQQYNEAISRFPLDDDNDEERANIYYGLACTSHDMGKLKESQQAAEQALKLYVRAEKHAMEAVARSLLGQIALENKDYSTAADQFTESLAISNTHAGPKMAVMNCASLAEVRLAEGRLDEARRYSKLACEKVEQVSNNLVRSQAYFTAAKVSHTAAQEAKDEDRHQLLEETISWLEKAKNCLVDAEAYTGAADIYKLWAQTLEELGQYREAIELWRTGYATLSDAKGLAWY